MPNQIIWRWWFMHEEDKSKGSTFPHWILQLNSRLNIQSNWRKKNPLHQENYTLRSCFSDYNQMFKKKTKNVVRKLCITIFVYKKRDKSWFMKHTYLSICFLKKCILKFKSKYIFKANNKIAYNSDILS